MDIIESIAIPSWTYLLSKGEKIATLEVLPSMVNMLTHFQIIENIGDHIGDYPGVCSASDRAFIYNCPDPNLLLKNKSLEMKKL
jgi:hypothetical protein